MPKKHLFTLIFDEKSKHNRIELVTRPNKYLPCFTQNPFSLFRGPLIKEIAIGLTRVVLTPRTKFHSYTHLEIKVFGIHINTWNVWYNLFNTILFHGPIHSVALIPETQLLQTLRFRCMLLLIELGHFMEFYQTVYNLKVNERKILIMGSS